MKRLAFILCTIFLVSCSSTPSDSVIQTAIARTQAAQPTPTTTPETTTPPLPLPTYTPSPTATIERTNTPVPPTATPVPHYCFSDEETSPDNLWVAQTIFVSCEEIGGPGIKVYSQDGTHVWKYQTRPAIPLVIDRWSADGQYLYFWSFCDTCKWYFYQSVFAYSRMRLETGQVEALAEAHGYLYNAVSLSPDESKLAYLSLQHGPQRIVIRDLQTGQEEEASLVGYSDGGNFAWSEDSKKVAFVVCLTDPELYTPTDEFLMLLDVGSMSVKLLATADSGNSFWSVGWMDKDTVVFRTWFSVNIATGELKTQVHSSTP